MPVFISYRHTDRSIAMDINQRLKRHGIITYLDVLDAESHTTDDITAVISEKMRACSHLIALVSRSTAESWWVPFEIGEATIIDRRISTYRVDAAPLPEYLDKWPIMTRAQDIELFVASYEAEKTDVRGMTVESMENYQAEARSRRSADQFHADLKRKLRLRP